MKLYSKDTFINAVSGMKKNGRLAHAFLLTGEKGTGKKTAALYLASTLLCGCCKDGIPCGQCINCRKIEKGIHPDVIIPERSGKKLIYNKDTVRNVCVDAYVEPNDCDAKVYIFADCENIEENTQNLMLKLIEEPPETTYFIFTAAEKSVFLPTILSRVINFGIPICSAEDCRKALEDEGKYSSDELDGAIAAYHGNIGCCKDYLAGGECAVDAELCRAVINAVADGNEYEVNRILFSAGDNRERLKAVLIGIDKVIRDACILRLEGKDGKTELISCFEDGARRLAARISFRKAENIHNAIFQTIGYCASNVNVVTAVPALCGVLSN